MTEKYKKIREIGRGSRAEVYLVRNTDTDDLLAMKIYRSANQTENQIGNQTKNQTENQIENQTENKTENKTESQTVLEAERELFVLKQLKQKGIPYLADCIRNDNNICIFMEYIEGKSLRRLMDEKHILDEIYASELALEIAELLCSFHKKVPAWIYADLKPENIMLSDKGDVYLVDFGSVLIRGEKNHPVHGTKAYAPVCEDEISPYRDTYALGAILYEMLTGFTYADGIKSGKADISHLSEPCREILQKAVRMRPEEGYSDAGYMKADIQGWADSLLEEYGRAQNYKKKGRIFMKNHQKKSERKGQNDYYIGDTKRFIRHGLAKYAAELAVCFLVIVLAVFAEASLKNKEIEAAEGTGINQTETISEISDGVTEMTDEITEINDRGNMSQEDKVVEYDVYVQPIGNHAKNKAVVVHQLSRN